MLADTGFSWADAENEFLRARRRQVLARLAHRLRREPRDINRILPLNEVLGALGKRGERHLGLQTIRLDTIIGTVDSRHDFGRRFRPTSSRCGPAGSTWRWRSAAVSRSRRSRCTARATLHFVIDGHHRVSTAVAAGQKIIDAYVIEVLTAVPAKSIGAYGDLIPKSHERSFAT